MLRYSDLTQEQIDFICNGCGGKGGLIKPPNFIFLASCKHHDFRFWVGHTWEHFFKANKDFYVMMKRDIANIKFYEEGMNWREKIVSISKASAKKAYYHTWAFSYFSAVNVGGMKYFYFADKPKTLEVLNAEMQIEALKQDIKEMR